MVSSMLTDPPITDNPSPSASVANEDVEISADTDMADAQDESRSTVSDRKDGDRHSVVGAEAAKKRNRRRERLAMREAIARRQTSGETHVDLVQESAGIDAAIGGAQPEDSSSGKLRKKRPNTKASVGGEAYNGSHSQKVGEDGVVSGVKSTVLDIAAAIRDPDKPKLPFNGRTLLDKLRARLEWDNSRVMVWITEYALDHLKGWKAAAYDAPPELVCMVEWWHGKSRKSHLKAIVERAVSLSGGLDEVNSGGVSETCADGVVPVMATTALAIHQSSLANIEYAGAFSQSPTHGLKLATDLLLDVLADLQERGGCSYFLILLGGKPTHTISPNPKSQKAPISATESEALRAGMDEMEVDGKAEMQCEGVEGQGTETVRRSHRPRKRKTTVDEPATKDLSVKEHGASESPAHRLTATDKDPASQPLEPSHEAQYRCAADRSKAEAAARIEAKKKSWKFRTGDWECGTEACGFYNIIANNFCPNCGDSRAQASAVVGEGGSSFQQITGGLTYSGTEPKLQEPNDLSTVDALGKTSRNPRAADAASPAAEGTPPTSTADGAFTNNGAGVGVQLAFRAAKRKRGEQIDDCRTEYVPDKRIRFDVQ